MKFDLSIMQINELIRHLNVKKNQLRVALNKAQLEKCNTKVFVCANTCLNMDQIKAQLDFFVGFYDDMSRQGKENNFSVRQGMKYKRL